MSQDALITADFPPSTQAKLNGIELLPELILDAIRTGMDKGGQIMLGKITQERFTGQGPYPVEEGRLGVRTNRLRGGLRVTPAVIDGQKVTAGMGSNVRYFGVHERGFDGTVEVRQFTRQVSGSQFAKKENAISPKLRGKKKRAEALGTETVKAHSRHMHMPARYPMGHGIADHVEDLTSAISQELAGLWAAMGQRGS